MSALESEEEQSCERVLNRWMADVGSRLDRLLNGGMRAG
jgi:hypothetical protein